METAQLEHTLRSLGYEPVKVLCAAHHFFDAIQTDRREGPSARESGGREEEEEEEEGEARH